MPPIFSFFRRKKKTYRRVMTITFDDPIDFRDQIELAIAKYRSVIIVGSGNRKATVYARGMPWEKRIEWVVKNALRNK
jgi:hypothetical protein